MLIYRVELERRLRQRGTIPIEAVSEEAAVAKVREMLNNTATPLQNDPMIDWYVAEPVADSLTVYGHVDRDIFTEEDAYELD